MAEACRRAGVEARARELSAWVAGYRGLNVNDAFVRNRAQWLMTDL